MIADMHQRTMRLRSKAFVILSEGEPAKVG
jgi:hypothetical protein